MSGRPAFERESYRQDINSLRRRGWTDDRIARHLGMSRATLYRIVSSR